MSKKDLLQEIKERVDIVDLIGEYITLKKAGQNYKGLCPFHSEKTPSFTVNPSKQIFYCFGCHRGGDQITFIMDYENLSFKEAVTLLCERAGINPEVFHGRSSNYKGIYYEINKEATRFYNNQLLNSKKALDYFKTRGLSDETIEGYELGYSSPEKDLLFRHLLKQGFKEEDIYKTGLVNFGNGKPFDFFRDRIMFPIFDSNSKCIAFGGRRLSEIKTIPKYINSPETAVFKKGESVFGINKAKNAITQKGYSVVVEGYMDVLMCHQFGFTNVVAPLGTALTEGHLKKLKKYSEKLLLVFDGDNAGIEAVKRALAIAFSQAMNTKIALLPNAEDPDSILRKRGGVALAECLSKAITPVAFYFRLYGKNNLDCVRRLLHLVQSTQDRLLREDTLREISERSGINELILRQELDTIEKTKNRKKPMSRETTKLSVQEVDRTEEFFVKTLLSCPTTIRDKFRDVDLGCFQDKNVRTLLQRLFNAPPYENRQLIEWLLENCQADEKAMLLRIAVETEEETYSVNAAEDCLKRIMLKAIDRRMKEATANGSVDLINRLLLEKRRLSAETFDQERSG